MTQSNNNPTMTWDELQDKLTPILHEILALRLAKSKHWNNVEPKYSKRKLKIRWFDPKAKDGSSETKDVYPFNVDTLTKEIATQFRRLQRDEVRAKEEEVS
jgi:hypothetical protein